MRLPVKVPLIPAPGCDCSRCPLWIDNPNALEPICSGCNADCAYCGCSRATSDGHGPGCANCPIRCGSRTDIATWMADVGNTLGFDDITIPTQLPTGLPRYIPQVDGHDTAAFDEATGWGAYAVGLRRVLSPTTHTIYPLFAGKRARDVLHLHDGQAAVLVAYGTDPLVEALWSDRHSRGLLQAIAAMEWDLVLAPNFSMFGNQPRAEHLLNFRRNMLIAAEMCALGIPAVPNIYWFRLEDLRRYIDWAHATGPAAVAINLQTFRTDKDWDTTALPGLTYLAQQLPAGCELIATGTSRRARINTLRELFGSSLRVVAQNALQYARHGAVMTPAGRVDLHARPADAFAASVRYYAELLDTDNSPPPQEAN